MGKGIKLRQTGSGNLTETAQINTQETTDEILKGKYPKKLFITTDGKNVDISYSDCNLLETRAICSMILQNLSVKTMEQKGD